ncbi:hypothetical protein [Actinomadura vinacea]|uniref:hypothetical protein n=1 Tax=Actinomadura vinacea TaxID=115336 RepID=UPI003CD066D6
MEPEDESPELEDESLEPEEAVESDFFSEPFDEPAGALLGVADLPEPRLSLR